MRSKIFRRLAALAMLVMANNLLAACTTLSADRSPPPSSADSAWVYDQHTFRAEQGLPQPVGRVPAKNAG